MQRLFNSFLLLCLSALCTVAVSGQPPQLQEVTVGGAIASATVSTVAGVPAAPDSVYVMAVATKPATTVATVAGLGLNWTPVAGHCAARNQAGLALWVASGSPQSATAVDVTFASTPQTAHVAVARFSNAQLVGPIANSVVANSNGVSGACNGGTDTSSYTFGVPVSNNDALAFAVVSHRHRSHTAAVPWQQQNSSSTGSGGSTASLTLMSQSVANPGVVTAAGSLSGNADWAGVAVELVAVDGGDPPPPPPSVITLRSSHSGGAAGSALVTTDSAVTASADDVLLAAIASKPYRTTTAVTGMGLNWQPLTDQCGARGQTGIALWRADGAATSGLVQAQTAGDVANLALTVLRYGGTDSVAPVGNVAAGNTSGGACAGGSDTNAWATALSADLPNAMIVSAVALRNRTHQAAGSTSETSEFTQGTGGDAAGLATTELLASAPGSLTTAGTLSGAADWAAVSVVLRPGSSTPTPIISATPVSHDFGSVLLGLSANTTVSVRNLGTQQLNVSATGFVGLGAADYELDTGAAPFQLAPGASELLQVRFLPSQEGTRSAGLRVTSDDPRTPQLTVSLTGVGAATLVPDIRATPSAVSFGNVVVGATANLGVVLHNDGGAALTLSALNIMGADAGEFELVGGTTGTIAPGASMNLTLRYRPTVQASASASLEVVSDDPDQPTLTVALTGTGTAAAATGEMWMSAAAIASRPMAGAAWEAMKATADGDLGTPNISDFTANHDVRTVAVALVYARTGQVFYRQKARDAIMAAIGTEDGTTEVVQVGRNTVPYVIAADMIRLSEFDPAADAIFRNWLDGLRFVAWQDGSIVEEDSDRTNNHGRMAGATRAAIAVYLGDSVEVAAAANVFHGFLGNRAAYNNFVWRHDLSWQADPANPVGINPVGAVIGGLAASGAMPEEMRRGCEFQLPPCQTGYPWEAMQGAYVEAVILHNAGFDVFNWENQALLRAVQFMEQLQAQFPNTQWWATGDDTWVPWLVNSIYGTNFPTERARIGKTMSWTDWSHAP